MFGAGGENEWKKWEGNKGGSCVPWGNNLLHMMSLSGMAMWMPVPGAAERCSVFSALTACEAYRCDVASPGHSKTPWVLAENLVQSLVLWKDSFLSLEKENPSARRGDKSSHSVQSWGCFQGFQQTHCASVLLINVSKESTLLLEGKWLLYLSAAYMWVLIKKDVLNQFYHNTIFPSFLRPSI